MADVLRDRKRAKSEPKMRLSGIVSSVALLLASIAPAGAFSDPAGTDPGKVFATHLELTCG